MRKIFVLLAMVAVFASFVYADPCSEYCQSGSITGDWAGSLSDANDNAFGKLTSEMGAYASTYEKAHDGLWDNKYRSTVYWCGTGSLCCTPSCPSSTAAEVCYYDTFSDGCGGSCSGTKQPVNGGWSGWSGSSTYQTRSCTNPSPECGGSYCGGASTRCQYYVDEDRDGFGRNTLTGIWREGCPTPPVGESTYNTDCDDEFVDDNDVCWFGYDKNDSNYYNDVKDLIDCVDYDKSICASCINPAVVESGFKLCIDGVDNDCAEDADYLDSKCQVDCDPGYEELLRYNDTVISESYVIDPDLMSEIPDKYQYYFPLCVQAEGLTTDCSVQGTIPVLKYDSNTETVASNATTDSDFNEEFCMNSVDCYVASSCNSTHTAIASLTQEFGATVGNPSTASAEKLCCALNQVGIQWEHDSSGKLAQYECNVISDGICPEDFEDVNGNRVSCEVYHDPDCGWGWRFYRSPLFRKPDFMLTFDERNYVLDADNSDSARVSVYNETDIPADSEYLYQFAITSDLDSNFSITTIEFSYGTIPEVSFDGFTIAECSSTPTQASDLDGLTGEACYEWDSPAILTLYHTLSDHTVDVRFNYSSIGVIIIVLLIFAIALPITLVRKANISLKLTVNKKEDLEHHIKTLAKEEKELEVYIKKAFDKGLPKSKIYATLLSAGWDRGDIDRIIKKIKK